MAGSRRGIIDQWLVAQSDDLQQEFYEYCRKNYHKKLQIHSYLIDRGCPINAITTVYSWVKTHIQPGEQAVLFNSENESYIGVEMLPLLERMAVQLSRIADQYARIIEDKIELVSLPEAMDGLPRVTRELRSTTQDHNRISTSLDYRTLMLAGASRMFQLLANSPNIRDQGDEVFLRHEMEAAILQIKNEIDQDV